MELQTLKIFSSIQEAHIVKARLESEGITAYLFDANIAAANPLYIDAVGGIKLKVNPIDFQAASELISEGDQVSCSDCGSMNTYVPDNNEKSFFQKFLHQAKEAFFSSNLTQKYSCTDCGAITEVH